MIDAHLLTGATFALVLIASFVGWGRLVAATLLPDSRAGWPWEAAWGVCALTILGGVLNAARLVSEPVAIGLILVGGVLFLGFSGGRDAVAVLRRWAAFPTFRLMLLALAAAFGAYMILISLYPLRWEPNDDALAYAVFPRQMLEAGWLNEPFSIRRILGYGGYQFLQALVLAPLSAHELHLLDRGVMTVLGSAALAFYLRRRLGVSRAVAGCAGIAFIAIPLLRTNLSPTSILSFLSIASLETYQRVRERPGLPMWRQAALLGLVVAGLLSVRVTAVGLVGTLFVLLVLTERSALRGRIALFAGAGVATALALLPWAWTLMRSSNTPLYPIIAGTYNREALFSVPLSLAAQGRFIWECLAYGHVHYLVLLTVAGALLGKMSRGVICYVAAAVATAITTIVSFNLWDAWGHYRFSCPYTTVAFHLAIGSWLARFAWFSGEGLPLRVRLAIPAPWRFAGAGVLFAVAVALLVQGRDLPRGLTWRVLDIDGTLRSRVKGDYTSALASEASYTAAFATIPEGATVLSAVDFPFLLDQRRHTILCIDEVGTASPPPGLPLGGTPDDLVAYLAGLSIDYAIFVRPENAIALYRREPWQAPTTEIWKMRAPFFLWFFDALEALAATDRKRFENRDAVVISLR